MMTSTTHTLTHDRQLDAGEATIRYVVAGEKAVFYPTDRERSYWPAEEHRVRIASMRPTRR